MVNRNITLLDYGMANLLNVARAFEYCGATVRIIEDSKDVVSADRLVVPGVGAFADVIRELAERGLDEAIRRFSETERPLFGICVGMQMLFDGSEEFGDHNGLGILPGQVKAVPAKTVVGDAQRVPHIGWNHLVLPHSQPSWAGTPLDGWENEQPAFYFVHSYSAHPDRDEDKLAECMYGGHRICAAVRRNNIFATQFHPERSGTAGLELIKKFLG
ncbi:imidazole glycerol phosphate synthase subunit HisH [Metapseudomonas otitidis]|uniref:imidazole glycerol phosphate synthase subunit HisH n=1 Tax=Metapseudomonas otitidis TaxID=319939 RepID=UPI00244886D9|nr:imidazole glycerol phosphate synthase subunit HisH [Pseudomonas otitidis]MDH0339712.1 imidazole glycerol phosphate synthase subunit HisH [Pseudomonas otitidis]